jgi:Rab family protein
VKEQSFANCARWFEDLRANAEPGIVVMLVGNKVDLVERNEATRQVPTEAAKKFAEANGLLFQETSAVTTTNVKEAFEILLQTIYNEKAKNPV